MRTTTTRYRVEGVVGTGPDGHVYRAMPERLGARPVAIRSARVPSGPARLALRHRAETLARVGHPALALVVEVIEVDEHEVHLVSELGADGNLDDRMRAGAVAPRDVAAIGATVASALAAAARFGLRHGHLTATNIVFGDRGPMVTDLALPAAATDDRHGLGELLLWSVASAHPPADAHAERVTTVGRGLCAGAISLRAAATRLRESDPRHGGADHRVPASVASEAPAAPVRRLPMDRAAAAVVVAGSATLGVVAGALSTALSR